MFDFKFEKSVGFSRSYEELRTEIKTEKLKQLAETFSSNIFRVKALGFLPLEMNYWSSIMASCIVQALVFLGKGTLDGSLDNQTLALANSYMSAGNDRRSSMSPLEQENDTIRVSAGNIKALIASDDSKTFATGHEAILSSMIVEAWSAFEALSVDLWINLLNTYPYPLATNFCRKSDAKTVTLDQIAKYGFDLRNQMGNIVRSFSKANFDDLKGINEAYKNAFGADFIDVLSDEKHLFIAEKTRHLIAHRSGIVDEKYLSQCKNEYPFAGFIVNERIPLDGIIVSQLVDACVQGGVDLLKWADKWSVAHG